MGRFPHTWIALAALAVPSLGGVRVVAPAGAPYATLQAAVDAAVDGDVVLVRTGDYAGCAIDGKALMLVEDAGASARVTSTLFVRNLAAGQCVVLAGFEMAGSNAPALEADAIQGSLRGEGLALRVSPSFANASVPAVDLRDVQDVAFVRSTFTGGATGNGIVAGGAGLRAQNAGLALYDCALDGAYGVYSSGRGGEGLNVSGGELFASNCDLRGGIGGPGGVQFTGGPGCAAWFPLPGGTGGDALRALSGATSRLLDCRLSGGAGGPGGVTSCGVPGATGTAGSSASGSSSVLAGVSRSLAAPFVAREGESVPWTVRGSAGERAWLFFANGPGQQFHAALFGSALIANPFAYRIPLGTIPASGELTVHLLVPELGPGLDARVRFVQALCTSSSGARLAGSGVVAWLDAAY